MARRPVAFCLPTNRKNISLSAIRFICTAPTNRWRGNWINHSGLSRNWPLSPSAGRRRSPAACRRTGAGYHRHDDGETRTRFTARTSLVNLGGEIPTWFSRFSRVAEIVAGDDDNVIRRESVTGSTATGATILICTRLNRHRTPHQPLKHPCHER